MGHNDDNATDGDADGETVELGVPGGTGPADSPVVRVVMALRNEVEGALYDVVEMQQRLETLEELREDGVGHCLTRVRAQREIIELVYDRLCAVERHVRADGDGGGD